MADDTSVDLVVRWAEAGADVPTRARASLAGLQQAADGATPAVGERLASAFARLEAREPTMVLRRARFAIEELAASAMGSTGPLGRLAASFAMLGVGGATGIVAIAGTAAVGVEVKQLIDFTAALDANLEKVNAKFAAMVPAAAKLHEIGALAGVAGLEATPLDDQFIPTQPGVFGRAAARIGDFLSASGEGDVTQAYIQQASSGLTTARLAEQREETLAREQHTVAIRAEHVALDTATIALERARLAGHGTWEQVDALAHREDVLRQSMTKHTDSLQRLIVLTDDVTRAQEHQNQVRDAALLERTRDFPFQNITYDPNDIYNRARDLNRGPAPPLPTDSPDAVRNRNAMLGLDENGNPLPASVYNPERTGRDIGDKTGEAVAQTLAAHLPTLLAAANRGDAGAAISTLGGGLESLSKIKGVPSELGPIGIGLSIVSSLTDLFSSGRAKVVATIDERSLQQLKQLAGVPNSAQIYIVDSRNVRQTLYDIDHAARKSASIKLPQP